MAIIDPESPRSPNAMLVDPQDIVIGQDDGALEDDQDHVAIINPDTLSSDSTLGSDTELTDAPPIFRADDYETMKEKLLHPLEGDPKILADGHHTWDIKDWRRLARKEHGPIFEVGGFPWRVLMFPFGNNNSDSASLYLEQGFTNDDVPDDFVCCVQFGIVMWNPTDPTIYEVNTAHHRFTKEEGDWGFTRFCETRKLHQPTYKEHARPLIENDQVMVTAYVRVVEDVTGVLWHNFSNYDSKKETGYVGLKNQGATCYLNSLVQSLYFTNAFRKAVYQIPTQNEETLVNSAYTLQRLFYQLQTSPNAVSTNELTKSFGWETRHIFEQQDVQELSRKLMEKMEEKMKGTEAEAVLPRLFCGKVRTYISCINVPYESARSEDFWDIQLNVSGNKDLEHSFQDYIQVETMDGENQYMAGDEFKLQDAKKGVIFESFPEVLHLQLKRFQYDVERDAMMKINDRYEFPETFDAAPYLAETADMSESWVYQLHGVLVHSGDLNAGHYYAFIKPNKDGWFYKYDDDKVTKATLREVMDDNYGGEYTPMGPKFAEMKAVVRQNSAYMLVYIRQSRLDEVLPPVENNDTPPHLQKKLDEEAAYREARRKEKEDAHLYLTVRVITDGTFRAHGGIDLTSFEGDPQEDPAVAKIYKLLRKTTIAELVERVGKDIEVDPKRLRMWCMVNRQNKTTRPDGPIMDSALSIEEAHSKLAGTKSSEFRLWAETADENADGIPTWPAYPNLVNGVMPKSDLIVLFLKHFNIEAQCLQGVGHIYISKEKKVEDLAPVILERMGWPAKTQLRLYEEIKPDMIDQMKPKQTLKAAELQDGDIICFQRGSEDSDSPRSSTVSTTTPSDHIDDARGFYDFLRFRKIVHLIPHPQKGQNQSSEEFDLVLSAKSSYDQLAVKAADKLGVDATHLRFWTINAANNNPRNPVKRQANDTVQRMLSNTYNSYATSGLKSDSLYFEILDMSLSELDTKRPVKVIWRSEGISKEEPYDVLVSKTGTIADVVAALVKQAKIDDETTGGPIQVYEISANKFGKALRSEDTVASIHEFTSLAADRVPEEDRAPGVQFILAVHFHSEAGKAHGIPFLFKLIEGEKFVDTKKRLEKRTGWKGKNFEKIKFAVIENRGNGKPFYLTDDMELWDVAPDDTFLLGLDHVDRKAARNGGGDLFLK